MLFDFGISKLISKGEIGGVEGGKHTGMCGSLRYMAPEVAMSKPYNDRSEIYSMSLILWEMLTHQPVYANVEAHTFEQMVCLDHVRPTLPDEMPDEAKQLLSRGWHPEHWKRPSAAALVGQLQDLKGLYEKHGGMTSAFRRRGEKTRGRRR